MRVVFLMALGSILIQVMLQQTARWQSLESFSLSSLMDDHRLLLCARWESYRKNLQETLNFLEKQTSNTDNNADLTEIQEILVGKMLVWQTQLSEDGVDCLEYEESYEIYDQYNAKLPEGYPNASFRLQQIEIRREGL